MNEAENNKIINYLKKKSAELDKKRAELKSKLDK